MLRTMVGQSVFQALVGSTASRFREENVMKSKNITITCYQDDKEVAMNIEAFVANGLALHRDISGKHCRWSITCVSSSNIISYFKASKSKALAVFESIYPLFGEWSSDVFSWENREKIYQINQKRIEILGE